MTTAPDLSPLFPYDPLTEEQKTAFNKLVALLEGGAKEQLSPLWAEDYSKSPEIFVSKFLTARKWIPEDALTMIINSSNFRRERKFDELPQFPACIDHHGFDAEDLVKFCGRGERQPSDLDVFHNAMQKVYKSSWHKWDKEGRPVYIERTGMVNVKEIVKRAKRMVPPSGDVSVPCVAGHLHSNEVGGWLLRYQNAKRDPSKPPITQVVVVMDCEGFTLGHLFGPAMDILKVQSEIDQANYPEGLHRLYVANAPTSLSIAFNIVKPWLDPRSIKKIVFMKPHETKEKLLRDIDASCLPEFLGGTCNCKGGCVGNPEDVLEEDYDETDANSSVVKTEMITVPAGKKEVRVVNVTEGTPIVWDYLVEKKYDISFEVVFEPRTGGKQILHPAARVKQGSDQSPSEEGTLTFTFDNSYAWMSKKTICFLAIPAKGN